MVEPVLLVACISGCFLVVVEVLKFVRRIKAKSFKSSCCSVDMNNQANTPR